MLRDWQIEDRQRDGLRIVQRAGERIERIGDNFLVPSLTTSQSYKVDPDPINPTCTCRDHEMFRGPCKHIFAVRFLVLHEQDKNALVNPPPKAPRPTYPRPWTIYNKMQMNEPYEFLELGYDLCQSIQKPQTGRSKGRPPIDIADTTLSALYKIYSLKSGRRFMSQLHEAYERGYLGRVLHFNRISSFLEKTEATDILKSLIVKTSRPLSAVESVFALDSTGFRTSRYSQWQETKYRGKKEHKWVKAHIMIGVNTHVVTDAIILTQVDNDHLQLPDLLRNTSKYFTIREVLADKGYAAVHSHEDITAIGADAYIPFPISGTGGQPSRDGVWEKAFFYYMFHRDEFLQHYHQRSNVETAIIMMKMKFDDFVRSKTPTAMVNEVYAKIVCHNICCLISSLYELKIAPKFLAGKLNEPVQGEG